MTEPVASQPPLVIVSIVHWNGGASTMACIESVFAEAYRPLRIVVVDNGSSDTIADEIERRWPAISVLRNEKNVGFTGGHNRGIAAAIEQGADHVLLLNQDALLVQGCIERMVETMESDAKVGLVSPIVYYADEPSRMQFCGSWLDLANMKVHYDGDLAIVRAKDADPSIAMCLWGTALMIRHAVVEQIGLLDQRLFAYYEDTDYSARSAAAGWRNRMSFDAGILHEGHPTRYTRAPNFFYFTCRNEMLFWRKALSARHYLTIRRRCVARVLREAAKLRDAGLHPQVEACMSGLWDAFIGRGGAFDPDRRAPRWLSRTLLRHPYFLANLLDGRPFERQLAGATGPTG